MSVYDETKYRPGLGRDYPHPKRSHLYEIGDNVMDFKYPMCSYGWNRDNGTSYSIWRNQIGDKGVCRLCIKRANKCLEPSKPKEIP